MYFGARVGIEYFAVPWLLIAERGIRYLRVSMNVLCPSLDNCAAHTRYTEEIVILKLLYQYTFLSISTNYVCSSNITCLAASFQSQSLPALPIKSMSGVDLSQRGKMSRP